MNGGTQVPAKEPTVKGVMDALMKYSYIQDESTLVGKKCDEEEGGVCFSVTSFSGCVSLLDSMTNTFEPIGSHTHENTLEKVDLRDTFLYHLFTYDDAHAVEWSMLLEGKNANLINGCALDPSTWLAFPFDPSSGLQPLCWNVWWKWQANGG
ncbi:hypothetical protein KY289_016372 [Solanum tuberosum]|nr:hypothetical protein KY284_018530 [Solanum tuberosum]KAH0689014.1 hypothetical protein KY289_016372 [Solanum tuberosum]